MMVRCMLVRAIYTICPTGKPEYLVTLIRLGLELQDHQGVVNTISKLVLQTAVLIIIGHSGTYSCIAVESMYFFLGLFFVVECLTLK